MAAPTTQIILTNKQLKELIKQQQLSCHNQ